MKKKALTHLISTDKPNVVDQICRFDYGLAVAKVADIGYPAQHLYITTDEEIIGEQWMIDTFTGKLEKGNKNCSYKLMKRKVVATDNPELWTIYSKNTAVNPKTGEEKEIILYSSEGVAKIPLSFLKEYVEKQPKEVMLEYEQVQINCPDDIEGCEVLHMKEVLKLNSSGEVIISSVDLETELAKILLKYIDSEQLGELLDDLKKGNFRFLSSKEKDVYEFKSVSPVEEEKFSRDEMKRCLTSAGIAIELSNIQLSKLAQWFDKNYPV